MNQEDVREDGKESHVEAAPLGYPKHSTSFETYYYLGESRSLRLAALIRFKQLVPDCPENHPLFNSKFESFYTKIKRWSKAEDWPGWVVRKDVEERQKHEKELRAKTVSQDKTLKMYQSLVRQALVVWSDKIRASVELRNAINKGDDEKIAEYMGKEKFELHSPQDVRLFMELDNYLTEKLETLPAIHSEEYEKLSEAERERLDKAMEKLRISAAESGKSDGPPTSGE